MPRTGRPPLTDAQVRDRISAYQARYAVKQLNPEGFPVFPAGLRETKQHREWMALYQLFNRSRDRHEATTEVSSKDGVCPICLAPGVLAAPNHGDCATAVDLVRRLGESAIGRIRAQALGAGHSASKVRGTMARKKG